MQSFFQAVTIIPISDFFQLARVSEKLLYIQKNHIASIPICFIQTIGNDVQPTKQFRGITAFIISFLSIPDLL